MLYAMGKDGPKQMTDLPISRKDFFNKIMRKLSADNYNGIVKAINEHFDKIEEVSVSSFIPPGDDWTNTPYEPICKVCGGNRDQAAFLFGILVWKVIAERPDYWGFVAAKEHFPDREIKGKIYFRIEKPREQ